MPIEVACQCGQRFQAEDRFAGRKAKCSACGELLTIPAPAARAAALSQTAVGPANGQPFVVACNCGARFQARADLAGKTVPCPTCKQPLTIRRPPAKAPPEAAARLAPRPQAQPQTAADPLGDLDGSLWNDLPSATAPLPAARTLPPAHLPSAGRSWPGASRGRRKLGVELLPGRKTSELFAGIILALLALAGGVGLGMLAMSDLSKSRATQSWPSVTGTIKTAEIVENGMRRGRQKYIAKVQYEYVVNGTTIIGERIAINGYGSLLTDESVIAKYATGSTHPVYYDPNDPDSAVLENGVTPTGFILPLFAIAIG
jgi:hypothetical protein